jgi:hypothetical protein
LPSSGWSPQPRYWLAEAMAIMGIITGMEGVTEDMGWR